MLIDSPYDNLIHSHSTLSQQTGVGEGTWWTKSEKPVGSRLQTERAHSFAKWQEDSVEWFDPFLENGLKKQKYFPWTGIIWGGKTYPEYGLWSWTQ